MTDREGRVKPQPEATRLLHRPERPILYATLQIFGTTLALQNASDVLKPEGKEMKATSEKTLQGQVHCPICTHNVDAGIDMSGKRPRVVPGQKCPRSASTLDAAFVLEVLEAA